MDFKRFIPTQVQYADCKISSGNPIAGETYQIVKTDTGICFKSGDKVEYIIFKSLNEEGEITAKLTKLGTVGFVGVPEKGTQHTFYFASFAKLGIKGVTITDDFLKKPNCDIDRITKEFVLSVGGNNFVILARKTISVESMKDTAFAFAGIEERTGNLVTLDCIAARDDSDNEYIEAITKRPLNNKENYSYVLAQVELEAFFTRKREVISKRVKEAIDGKKNSFLEIWREYCLSSYERIINACLNAGILEIEMFDGEGYIVKDNGANTFSNFIAETEKAKIDDCWLLFRVEDSDDVKAMNDFRDHLKGQSQGDKERLILSVREHLEKRKQKTNVNIDIAASKEKGKIVLQANQEIGGIVSARLYDNKKGEQTLTFPVGSVKFNIPDGIYNTSTDQKISLLDSVSVMDGHNANDFRIKFNTGWSNQKIQAEISRRTTFVVKDQEFHIQTRRVGEAAFIIVSGRKTTKMLENIEREFARIMEGKTPMPQLSEILLSINSENSIKYKGIRRKKVHLEDAIKNFKFTPTFNQTEALRIALETPDIAIILGPPGTGKSELIRGICKAIEDKEGSVNGTLLTAYQHDALDSLMEDTEVNGLPCIRYGGKDRSAAKVLSLTLATQIRKKAEELEKKYPEYAKAGVLYLLKNQIAALDYLQLSFNNLSSYLDGIARIVQDYVSYETRKKLQNLSRKYLSQLKAKKEIYRPASLANCLRTSKVAFEDDGELCLSTTEINLEAFSLFSDPKVKKLFEGYKAAVKHEDFENAKKSMLQLVAYLIADKKPVASAEEKKSILKLLQQVAIEVEDSLALSGDLESEILSDFINTYKNNYGETLYAIKKYNKYSGSTHHQLEGNLEDIGLANRNDVEFENVIIDEAARSSPNDLVVVMSKASNRIIFVGDHNQLPQFQDKDLYQRALESIKKQRGEQEEQSDKGDSADKADCSLFEKLIEVVERMKENDGITRFAMLKEQFRSPPLLGEFISREFYQGKLVNGKTDTSKYEHDIPKYRGLCAVFKDFDFEYGRESKDAKKSRFRTCEAEWIAKDIKEVLDTRGNRLSIGVMSFYKAQCTLIENEIVKIGVAVMNDDGTISIAPKYANAGDTLFIGTVDAYQGKQFDIVYLSVTVANNKKDIGFLESENRRCVALSREKKLLIVVGAPEMLKGTKQINSFRELCQRENKGRVLL